MMRCLAFFCCFTLLGAVTFGISACHEEEKNMTGKETVVRFQVDVETDTNNSGGCHIESDWCVLMLPKNSGKLSNIPLVIYCHSGGGTVNENGSEPEESDFARYFVSKGWAVLGTAGMPESYSERLKIDHKRCLGNPVSVRSVERAYDYIKDRYKNIDYSGCVVFCNSNGGLTASSLVNHTSIPVLAQSGLCPLISIEKNVWDSLGYKTGLIRLYGMKSGTYEKDKVGKFDPYVYNTELSTPYKCPYLIIQPRSDRFVSYDIAVSFAKIMNEKGSRITVVDTEEVGGHNVVPRPVIIGDYEYMEKTYPLNKTVNDVYLFFCKYKMNADAE